MRRALDMGTFFLLAGATLAFIVWAIRYGIYWVMR